MKDPLIILIVILAIVIVWRGPKTLPQIGRMLGRGVKEAKREAAEIKVDIHKGRAARPRPMRHLSRRQRLRSRRPRRSPAHRVPGLPVQAVPGPPGNSDPSGDR